MTNEKSSRLTAAVIVVAVALLVAGGASVASNMGFKMNRSLVFAGTGQIGNNWTSIPYNNPYGTVGQFCSQTGLSSTGSPRATVTLLNENTGLFAARVCGTAPANAEPLVPGKGASVRQPSSCGTCGVPAPTSIIIVGSHNPSQSLTVPDAGVGQIGNFWLAVPYHTTAATVNDLCLSIGLTSTGSPRASVTKLNGSTGLFAARICGTSPAASEPLVLGEHVQIREPNGPLSFIPAHF